MPDMENAPDYTRQTIDSGRLYLQKRICHGASGVVYQAVDILDPARQTYAVKWIGLSRSRVRDHADTLSHIENEATCHARAAKHPNIVAFERMVVDDVRECRWLVLQWCPGGDTFDALSEHNFWWGSESRARVASLQLIDAVVHCHANGVFHRDIKPENVLCSSDGSQLYLADFGAATVNRWSTDSHIGTKEFLSPEVLATESQSTRTRSRFRTAYSSEALDVWSLGLTLLNLLSGAQPWKSASAQDSFYTQWSIRPERAYLYQHYPISREAHDLICQALSPMPEARPTAREFRDKFVTLKRLWRTKEEMTRDAPLSKCMRQCIAYNDTSAARAKERVAQHSFDAELSAELERAFALTPTEDVGDVHRRWSRTSTACASASESVRDDSDSEPTTPQDWPTLPQTPIPPLILSVDLKISTVIDVVKTQQSLIQIPVREEVSWTWD